MSRAKVSLPLQSFLSSLRYEIKKAREGQSTYGVDHHCSAACGMVYAALTLQVITGTEYDRLSTLAIEAADYRRNERINNQAPYTWKPAKAKAQEAAA
jgi:hypothetical protein